MGRDASATPGAIVAEAVIPADDLVAVHMTKAERNATVITDVARGSD
jgi:hypothetical protein